MNVTIDIPPWANYIISDLTDMDRKPYPVNAKSVKRFNLSLPDDVYFEYGFIDEKGNIRADPLAKLKAENPWYPTASAIKGPDYKANHYALLKTQAQGTSQRFRVQSDTLQETRRVISYTPKGFEDKDLPVIYLQDGVAYYRIARLPDVLEALLASGLVRPAHLVFVEPNDRTKEYLFNASYQSFMLDELIPFIEDKLAVNQERILMGASLGGLFSATLALHKPGLFRSVIAQSAAFLGSPEELDFYKGQSSWVLDEVTKRETLDLRWYLQVGSFEWLTEINQKVYSLLNTKGYVCAYREYAAGHNWMNWRNGLAEALQFALATED